MPRFRVIGLWLGEHDSGWPDVRAFVRVGAPVADRDRIADRLESGHRTERAYMGHSRCRICGCSNGSGEQTDGEFIWPEGLAHDVRHHGVALPDEIEGALAAPPTAPASTILAAAKATNEERDVDWWRSLAL